MNERSPYLHPEQFLLTEQLATLLRNSYVSKYLSGCEYGAAEINGKRPYGNSDVEGDICELLDITGLDADGNAHEANREIARKLHELTPTALQIVLSTGSFEPGLYESSKYGRDWRRVDVIPDGQETYAAWAQR